MIDVIKVKEMLKRLEDKGYYANEYFKETAEKMITDFEKSETPVNEDYGYFRFENNELIAINLINLFEITELKKNTFMFTDNVKFFSISSTPITNIHQDFFKDFPNLIKIDVMNAKFETLPSGLFDGIPNLEIFRILDTPVENIPIDILNLKNLEIVSFENTELTKSLNYNFNKGSKRFEKFPKLIKRFFGNTK